MARTFQQIYDQMANEKSTMANLTGLQPGIDDSQALLTQLTTTSRVARWRLVYVVVAFAIMTLEVLFDLFRADVNDTISRFRPGTLRWYQQKAFEWQYGDELTWNDTERKYEYVTIDESKQLVKLCSVTEPGGVVRIKAATLAGDTVVKLSAPQLASLNAYFARVKYPGPVACVSYDADLLKVYATIKYDAIVDLDQLKQDVEAAIQGYCKGLPFNGRFNINTLTDKIQQVTGVVDPVDCTVSTKYGGLPYSLVNDEYQTYAGYAQIDPLFPLSVTITYLPYV